jgi:hypothetical protein
VRRLVGAFLVSYFGGAPLSGEAKTVLTIGDHADDEHAKLRP